mmetsp:Transcript_39108/g.92638  ORF Transcript_39108/g.92638 Transcript_39108/m.92638 type:complete len:230 (+) Transcript_39108:1444-2133(+)
MFAVSGKPSVLITSSVHWSSSRAVRWNTTSTPRMPCTRAVWNAPGYLAHSVGVVARSLRILPSSLQQSSRWSSRGCRMMGSSPSPIWTAWWQPRAGVLSKNGRVSVTLSQEQKVTNRGGMLMKQLAPSIGMMGVPCAPPKGLSTLFTSAVGSNRADCPKETPRQPWNMYRPWVGVAICIHSGKPSQPSLHRDPATIDDVVLGGNCASAELPGGEYGKLSSGKFSGSLLS